MKKILHAICILIAVNTSAQELYPFTEPASNMPAKSISGKLSGMFGKGIHRNRLEQRYIPEVMFGLTKKWMIHASVSFSNLYETF